MTGLDDLTDAELVEVGRRLASVREGLIALGSDPATLSVVALPDDEANPDYSTGTPQ